MPTPLGDRIKVLRTRQKLTLEKLASEVGSSKSYMWEIENKDVARPSAEKLQQIAVALGTTTNYLLAADDISEEDAADRAFYELYRTMKANDKAKLQKLLKILREDD